MLAQVSQLALCKRLAVGMRVSHCMWQSKLEVRHAHGGWRGTVTKVTLIIIKGRKTGKQIPAKPMILSLELRGRKIQVHT